MKHSQFEEDDILRKILAKFRITPYVCDIGARYKFSNSAMLLREHEFDGRLIDMNPQHCWFLHKQFWKPDIIREKITPENVNYFVPDDVGVLSIDIDGNDYHVWKALTKTPQVVIIEFGIQAKAEDVGEYDPESRKRKDVTGKQALIALGREKGYRVYDSTRVNLIFIHETVHATA